MLNYKVLLPALVVCAAALGSTGCGSGGGSAGDQNDPATTSDLEQMADETDERLKNGQAMQTEE